MILSIGSFFSYYASCRHNVWPETVFKLEEYLMEAPEKNLALDLVRVTEAAALASARWLGKGNNDAGDAAAVDAMRLSFNSLNIKGTVIIGEGEKDNAPMLYCGEKVGTGNGLAVDVAVDPVEGTKLLAYGRPNAISVVGTAPAGTMYNPGPSFYMQKLVVPPAARNAVDIDAPVKENLNNIAKALGKDVDDLVVFVLDKPRHEKLIAQIRQAGARIQLHTDGDVAGALMAVDPRSEVDVMMGTGGTPEGVLAACAIKGIGGQLFARLDPQSYVEKEAIQEAGIDLREIHTVDTLVRSDDVFFAATGISGGTFLRGVQYTGDGAITHSMVIRGKTGSIRYMEAIHNWSRLMRISSVKYD
ncbi:fructose-1,6-bisphosphatase [Desulfovibrio psychrotolerans]|uniref:Fructose-1,6-bisphosphatase n=2 Tax=Desulfovibrio psychrotolerans TaxID=415242 RepID=A0A7J0BYW5_9BACT|nr:fructose-1,6-bisphosphatase [Desulfovibrio psychrotolerans]